MADALRPNAHVDVTCVCNKNERETEERGVQVGEYEGVKSDNGEWSDDTWWRRMSPHISGVV
jgi:hypothetical protein